MAMLNKDGSLKPGTKVYKIVREIVSDKIDRLGPGAALLQVVDRKPHSMEQFEIFIAFKGAGAKVPPFDF
jgi:hypothetical protein